VPGTILRGGRCLLGTASSAYTHGANQRSRRGENPPSHLKEHSSSNPTALLGEGDVDWRGLFDVVEAQNATDWLIVEHEGDAVPPRRPVRDSS